jgi:hypothetical protein
MKNRNVLAVPVVSDDGTVVATLSASDLRGLNSEMIKDLKLPVLDFLKV